jgi:hypothetical protein
VEPPLFKVDVERLVLPGYVSQTFPLEVLIAEYCADVNNLDLGTFQLLTNPDFMANNKNWSDTFILLSLFKSYL